MERFGWKRTLRRYGVIEVILGATFVIAWALVLLGKGGVFSVPSMTVMTGVCFVVYFALFFWTAGGILCSPCKLIFSSSEKTCPGCGTQNSYAKK